MNGGNLNSAQGRLQEALETLLLAWKNTHEVWRDEQARRFFEDHLQPLVEQLGVTGPALTQMAQFLARAARECNE